MGDEVGFSVTFVGHVRQDLQLPDLKRKDLIQKIIVVSTQVINARVLIFHHFENPVEKPGVFSFPAPRFFELPAVDDVAI